MLLQSSVKAFNDEKCKKLYFGVSILETYIDFFI